MERGKPLERRTPLSPGTKGLTRSTGLAAGKGLAPGKGFGTRKPMDRGAGLERGTGLTQGGTLARSAPAQRPRKPRVAPEVRDAVLVRSGGRCEVAATADCVARGRSLESPVGMSQHHRRPGRMGGSKAAGTNEAANLLAICGSGTTGCHGAIESNRTEALAFGWLLHAGQDPAVQPVRLWDGRRVLLTATGYVGVADSTPTT